MIVQPIHDTNKALLMVAEQTRRTIIWHQEQIASLEAYLRHSLELAGEPLAPAEKTPEEMAASLSPMEQREGE